MRYLLFCALVLCAACNAVEGTESNSTNSVSPSATVDYSVQGNPTFTPTIGESRITPTQTETATPAPIASGTPATVITITPDTTTTLTPAVTNTSTLLEGPLIAYRVQNGQSYLLLLDVGTLTFREIRQEHLEIPFYLEWLDSGCHLYARGNIINLQGNIVEKTDDPEVGAAHFQVPSLSPDRKMGVRELFFGIHETIELDFLSLEILDRTDPNIQIILAPNGGAYAHAWSPDGSWLAFSDYDENFILQVYRATPDGQIIEQLTNHAQDPGVINFIKWSPNGNHIAYAASAFLPGQFETGIGGWIGLISLADLQTQPVTPDNFVYTDGLWWSRDSKRIGFVGESFADVSVNAQVPGTQTYMYWADGSTGTILNTFYEDQAPSQSFSLIMPVGSLDSVFFAAKDGYYLLDATTNTYRRVLDEIPTDGLIRDFAASPFDFPGEAACLDARR